ncbi:MAG TPA: CHAT domain-containing tetratricopeptide repeat protein [Pyrinomonadaceae bacterium]|nr:CHAT domain-containing tetratricopeptide repeat protein [Pyrinomonadaceae bacterium]
MSVLHEVVMKFINLVVLVSLFVAAPVATANRNAVFQPQADSASSALREGRRLLKSGKADQAMGPLQKALELYTAANNKRGIAAAHNELGDLYLRQGQNKTALGHYQTAYETLTGAVSEEQRGASIASSAAHRADSQAGRLTDTAASSIDTGFNAQLLLAKIGDTNYRLGQMGPAASAYARMSVKKPESAAKKVGGLFGRIAPSIALGNATDSATIGSAAGAVGGALVAKNELDQYRTSIIYMTYHLGMGRIAFAGNDLDSARTHFQEAVDAGKGALPMIANLGQTRRFRAAALTSLADVVAKQGKPKDAVKLYEQAVKGAKDDKRLDLIWPAQRGLGRSLWLQAQQERDAKKSLSTREAALKNYRESIQTIESLRAGSLRADEARTSFLATTKDVYDETASAFAEMAILSSTAPDAPLAGKALEYAAEGFRVVEQSRARSLLDLLNETGASITEGIPPALLQQKQANLDRQQVIAEELMGISLTPDDQKKKPSDLEEELEKLQVEFDSIENQIRTASPRYASLTAGQTLSLAEVQQKLLDDQTVLLEYSLGPEASYVWAISKNEAALRKLPGRSAVDGLATALRAQLIPAKLQRRIVGIDVADAQRGLGISATPFAEDAAGFVAASSALYKAVVAPVAAMLGEKRLLIAADGALNYIPFEALVKTSDSGDYTSVPYLIKTNEIVYAPSASVVGAIRQQQRPQVGNNVLVVADPVFNSADTRARGAAVSATATADTRGLGIQSALTDVSGQETPAVPAAKMQGLPLARLAGTRSEAEQIVQLTKTSGGQADMWLDLDASEDNLETRDVRKYRVLHIATHGLLNAERPQFTGVVLSLVGNKTEDGFLRTDEVFNLKLGSPLVILSACETGLGKEKLGEGVMGLTRAFMYAGAPTVGVSLWSVADKSSAELMTDFYKRLLTTGATPTRPSAAMREAQLAMIAGKKYSAPFYWAPFVLVGDWQ